MTAPEEKPVHELEIAESLEGIDPAAWNALSGANNPFCEWEFLRGLEATGCVGPRTGWVPRFILVRRAGALAGALGGTLIGALPLYLRGDSYGEYIFDWEWAHAYDRAGIRYYPKATVAVPFTPATGERLLVHPEANFEEVARVLMDAVLELTGRLEISGLHVLFATKREHDFLTRKMGLLSRETYQFHWENRGYGSFEDFLADLRSSKRKNLKKERAEANAQGLEIELLTGDEIRAEHLAALRNFYHDTTSRKWGRAYLTGAFFDWLAEHLRRRMVLVMAKEGGRYVAGTLNFRKGENLYGRYWGAAGHYPCLHFELCYYRLIDYAIATGVQLFEAGAQGEHKFLRGFAARPTYSAHWIAHPGGRAAISDFLGKETPLIRNTIEYYNARSPLKHVRAAAQQAPADRAAAGQLLELDYDDER